MSCGIGRRLGSDPELLWLWCRPAATALIRPLTWEPPYAAGATQEMAKRPKKKKKERKKKVVAQKFSFNAACTFFKEAMEDFLNQRETEMLVKNAVQ